MRRGLGTVLFAIPLAVVLAGGPTAAAQDGTEAWKIQASRTVMARLEIPAAVRQGPSLCVRIRFDAARDGRIGNVALVYGSGVPAWDQAALAAVRRASPLPPPPATLAARLPISLSLPFHFVARDGDSSSCP